MGKPSGIAAKYRSQNQRTIRTEDQLLSRGHLEGTDSLLMAQNPRAISSRTGFGLKLGHPLHARKKT
jgi:hypothetical protein